MNIWYFIAQILGLVTIIFVFASYQIKDKAKYFLYIGISSFFWMTMFVSMGLATEFATQLSLIVASSYSTVRNLVFWKTFSIDTEKSRKFRLRFLIVMIVIALVAGTLSVLNTPEQVRWLHIIGMIAALCFVIGQYLPGVHYVRITVTIYALVVILTQTPLNILYGDFRWNIMGIAIELAKISSVAVFYLRLAKEKKT